ncbi:MAG: hypothetical protein AAFV88_05675 [Planctomycetota bacterium]
MPIEPLYLLIALLPLVAYLLVLGVIRLSGRVLVTTGGRDIAALGFAISGLVAIGPIELFFPKAAAGVFGPWIWVTLGLFYGLIVTLIALTSRPKLVVYGRSPEEVMDALHEASLEIDADSECDRERMQIFLPRLRVHLRAAGFKGVDSTSIESFEPITSTAFWETLLGQLRANSDSMPKPSQRRGAMMIVVALSMAAMIGWQILKDPQAVVEAFSQWLWR